MGIMEIRMIVTMMHYHFNMVYSTHYVYASENRMHQQVLAVSRGSEHESLDSEYPNHITCCNWYCCFVFLLRWIFPSWCPNLCVKNRSLRAGPTLLTDPAILYVGAKPTQNVESVACGPFPLIGSFKKGFYMYVVCIYIYIYTYIYTYMGSVQKSLIRKIRKNCEIDFSSSLLIFVL